ncbi:Mur ligase family protein [Labrys wisconsinensis]|uniref:UDP-N-acetylmuramoyl-tripeptide--D-alanyl-D-alanine ligase n=1 Tax=Labrys wisconsinensis TaxID=425677 RepID=A0ABU0JE88_9HYPH|nr:UDP-N-acetylmuramoyl-tripeptide--D-alanyl-D-alanine ligase [Labrys wisconsinensis]MDQ0472597.1 UDP-N-acetylmuramoyl-tripeptide--D-alanyl-D-alanine ligase [Labrys wisconsinensis]
MLQALEPHVPFALVLAGFAVFAWRRLMTYLHIFQQEEYDGGRFLTWMLRTQTFDRRASLALLALFALSLIYPVPAIVLAGFMALALLVAAWRERDPRKEGKKKLAMTQRATRIFRLAFGLLILVGLLAAALAVPPVAIVAWVQGAPLALVAAVMILQPQEDRIQQGFWNEAHEKLQRLAPVVVGVTGSYGKTSTKHILGHILESTGSAIITPGSVNTPMGIARIVRERLEPYHRHFVVEMGAYGPGSIARLCRLAPPDIAVVTAVGPAHYERFKSLDAVARTKFELPEAAIARGGKAIVNDEVLAFADAKAFSDAHRASMVLVGEGEGSDARITAAVQEKDGIRVALTFEGQDHTLFAPLYGLHHGRNMALAFVTALAMGVDAETALVAMKSTPQIAHRLEVKRQGDGVTIVDDGYNSNPAGFASALDILPLLVGQGGRRILVTPGMVELGEAHEAVHRKVGARAAGKVDILLAVAPARIEAFIEAYKAGNPDGEVVECAAFRDAQAWMGSNLRTGDVVLIENDLPDLYERKLSL